MDVGKGHSKLLILVVLVLALAVIPFVTAPVGPVVPGCVFPEVWSPTEAACRNTCQDVGPAHSAIGLQCNDPTVNPNWHLNGSVGIGGYCSFGQDDFYDGVESIACCPIEEWWDSGTGTCRSSIECYVGADPAGACDYDPAIDPINYALDTGCFNDPPTTLDTGWSCCQVNLYGNPSYWNHSVNPTPVFPIATFDGVEFCADPATTILCGLNDGVCPQDYFPGNPYTCTTPDIDCITCGPGTTFNVTSGACDETNCNNDIDDDGDGLTDLCDSSCGAKECTAGSCCLNSHCES